MEFRKKPQLLVAGQRVLLGLLLSLLLLPGLQAQLHWLPEGVLGGAYNRVPRPVFSWSDLRSSHYQSQFEEWIEDQLGFRNFLDVRSQGVMAYLSTVASSKNYGTSTSRQRPHNSGSTTQYPT